MTNDHRPCREIDGKGRTLRELRAGRKFKRYPAYKDSGVEWLGEIPAHWESLALKRIVDPARPVTYGIVQCGPDYPGGVPYIRPVDMDDEDGVDREALQRTTPEIAAAYARSMIRPDDVLVSIGPSFGKAMIVPADLDGANLTQGTARVAPGRRVTSRFLFWVLRSGSSQQAWDSYCSGATFRALTLEILETCAVTLPSTDEQRAITTFLDRETAKIDALVAMKKRVIELLQEKRTALITRAVTKGLDPNVAMKDSGVDWLGEIPAHWTTLSLRRLLLGIEQGWSPNAEEREASGEEWAVIKLSAIHAGRFDDREHKALPSAVDPVLALEVKTNDVLLTRSNTPELVGDVCFVSQTRPKLMLCDLVYRLNLRHEAVVGRFVVYWLLSRAARNQIEVDARGSSQSMVKISQGHVRSWLIAVPPPAEQERVANYLDEQVAAIEGLISKIQAGISRLKEFRTALISAAVTGKIDIREASAVP